jgi:hypothetical protein
LAQREDQGQLRRAFHQPARQARPVGGVVLAVAIHHHHHRRARGQHARADGAALAGVARVPHDAQARQVPRRVGQALEGGVTAGVVHHDDLVVPVREGGGDLTGQGGGGAFLVVEGHDDGDLRTGLRADSGHLSLIDEKSSINRCGLTHRRVVLSGRR